MVFENKELVPSEKEKAKLKLAKEVRELYNKGYSKRKISKLLNIHRSTVDKYLDNNFSPTNMNKGKRLPSMLDSYKRQIQVLKRNGKSNKEIFEIIRGEGYTGSYSNIGIYLAKRNLKIEESKEIRIKRKDLIKLLYKPIEEVETISKELYEKIIQRYQVIESIISLVNEFKQMLKSKNVEKIEEWIEKASNLKIRKIDKFVSGLKRDMQAVRNAIIYEYNH
ncbi:MULTISPECIES: helix-turn-helix domain-containing protein [Petrotoga]|uniref:Homeodomain-like domain-containing protein n=1 Tax=Petrotoga sibirica TaxID=156202 RepID=A0A4R8EXJ8_9BACT|nr:MULTISPECIES: helix-turn-helix domain-containing protein [Petrotoga]TDX17504.1 Homeodomain-like domain-containing protein [Petrotoga sibirica]